MCGDETHICTKKKAILKKKKKKNPSCMFAYLLGSISLLVVRAGLYSVQQKNQGYVYLLAKPQMFQEWGFKAWGFKSRLKVPLNERLYQTSTPWSQVVLRWSDWKINLFETVGASSDRIRGLYNYMTNMRTMFITYVKLKGDMFRNSEMKHQWCKQHFSS